MQKMEETILINGQEVIINHAPVRIFDEAGNEVGKGTLGNVIEKDLWCRSVHAWMVNVKGEVYIHQRSFKVLNNPGKWGESCGGYVDDDMTPDETLESEAHEEIGITLNPAQYQMIGTIKQYEPRHDGKVSKQFVSVYLIERDFTEDELKLCDRDVLQGKTSIHLSVKIDEQGNLQMLGHDIGEAPQQMFGKDDYEYSVTVGKQYRDYVLLLLIKQKFKNDSEFSDWLKTNTIEHSTWNSA